MLAYTYVEKGRFELLEKPNPVLQDASDAIVRVTLASICTSDLHINHGSVPRAVPQHYGRTRDGWHSGGIRQRCFFGPPW